MFFLESNVITCPNCGRENEDEYKYCLGCGTVLPQSEASVVEDEGPETVECPSCGAQVPNNFKFCNECGAPLQEAKGEASSTQPGRTAGAQAAEQVGRLVVIKPDGTEGAKVPLAKGEVKLGRDSEYEVLSSDPFLSPHHATLVCSDNGFLLRDPGSLNGVFVRIKSEVELTDGDVIRLGQELLRFHLAPNVEPVVPAAEDDKTLTGGSPDPGYWGRLSLVSGPNVETRGFVFAEDEITIGREIGDILFRDDGFVSGKHARLARIEGKVFLKDLGSSNGTYIRIRGDRTVSDGDLILMGQQLFRLEA